MTFLTTKNLFLRGLEERDVDGPYFRWMNDFEITRYLESRFFPHSREALLDFVRNAAGGGDLMLAICLKEDDRHIGNIKLGSINRIHSRGEIGLLIGESNEHRKGYATEAIAAITDFAFNELNLNKVWAGCYANNLGSARAFEKAGFAREATLKRHFFSGGEWVDTILLAKFRNPAAGAGGRTASS